MSNAEQTSGILARILLDLARKGAIALNRVPVQSAADPVQSAKDLAKLVRELVAEKVLDGDGISTGIQGMDYVGEFGPELCSVCLTICDFGSFGTGGANQNPHTGTCVCSDECGIETGEEFFVGE